MPGDNRYDTLTLIQSARRHGRKKVRSRQKGDVLDELSVSSGLAFDLADLAERVSAQLVAIRRGRRKTSGDQSENAVGGLLDEP